MPYNTHTTGVVHLQSVLDLPQELLVQVIAEAALNDVSSLANLALTCRKLHRIISSDDVVWRTLHLLEYDDPRKACAFLTPRTEYDWKQRVLDRHYVVAFLRNHGIPHNVLHPGRGYQPDMPETTYDAAERVLSTVLSLYLDLPAAGTPSRNMAILITMLSSQVFLYISTNFKNNDCYHLQALFLHLKAFINFRNRHISSFMEYHQTGQEFDSTMLSRTRPSRDTTYWYGLRVDVEFAVREFHVHSESLSWGYQNIEAKLVRQTLQGGIEAVRGRGILGLQRPLLLNPGEVWDWADVQGTWYSVSTGEGFAESEWVTPRQLEERGERFEGTDYMHLTPVLDQAAISEAYNERFGRADERLWADFPRLLDPSPDLLPALYFIGGSTRKARDYRPAKFMFGAVELTHDSPPELRWTYAVIEVDRPGKPRIFQGVQVGGKGAPRGVFGPYKYWNRGPDKKGKKNKKRRTEAKGKMFNFHQKSDGMTWFFKVDEVPSDTGGIGNGAGEAETV